MYKLQSIQAAGKILVHPNKKQSILNIALSPLQNGILQLAHDEHVGEWLCNAELEGRKVIVTCEPSVARRGRFNVIKAEFDKRDIDQEANHTKDEAIRAAEELVGIPKNRKIKNLRITFFSLGCFTSFIILYKTIKIFRKITKYAPPQRDEPATNGEHS